MGDRHDTIESAATGIGKLLLFLMLLNVFFVSISLLGAFKDLGHGQGEILIRQLAANPIAGLLLGIVITSVIQSSSTTTSIVVALTAAGSFGPDRAESLYMAIPIIMGANVGTSVTNLLVSLSMIGNRREFERAFSCAIVHDFFNVMAVLLFLPLQMATDILGKLSLWAAEAFDAVGGLTFVSPLKLLVKPQTEAVKSVFANTLSAELMVTFVGFFVFVCGFKLLAHRTSQNRSSFGMMTILAAVFTCVAVFGNRYADFVFSAELATFLFGLCVLFASLWAIVKLMKSVVLTRVEGLFHNYIFKTPARAMAVGAAMTAGVQSSSVTTSMVIPLAGAGIVNIRQVFPFTLGANVGTTITAILAALSAGQLVGVAVAFAHLFFNILGILVIYPFRRIPIGMAERFAHLATRHKAIPVLFVLGLYILIPMVLLLALG